MLSVDDVGSISPKFMEWNHLLWVIDIEPCLDYWLEIFKKKNARAPESLAEMVKALLSLLTPEPVRAAVAQDPWQAILLLHMMKERQIHGVLDISLSFGAALYRQLSWELWHDAVERQLTFLLGHASQKRLMKEARRSLTHMKSQMQTLGLDSPLLLTETPLSALQRRFGTVLAQLFQRSFASIAAACDDQKERPLIREELFPWIDYKTDPLPERRRHLDFALTQWESAEPLLREDLALLCQMKSFPDELHVLLLEWKLVFDDLSSVEIPIRFRHPHALHKGAPHFNTALLQAAYSFKNILHPDCHSLRRQRAGTFSQGLGQEAQKLSAAAPFGVVSWTLTAREMLPISPKIKDIFGTEHSSFDALADLENRLSVPLVGYRMENDWAPDESGPAPLQEDEKSSLPPLLYQEFVDLARYRPLFLYRTPQASSPHALYLKNHFLERTRSQWWKHQDARPQAMRNYYLLKDAKRRNLWAYRQDHEWCICGIFN
jgi:hypothetical protein